MRHLAKPLLFGAIAGSLVAEPEGVQEAPLAPEIIVDVIVKDESGSPLEGVMATFYEGAGRTPPIHAKTDAEGKAILRGRSWLPPGVGIRADGYYPSSADVDGNPNWATNPEPVRRKAELVLRERGMPHEMLTKRVATRMPGMGVEYAFDLDVGDWIAPHGEGAKADIMLKATADMRDPANPRCRVDVTFPQDGDGVQEDKVWIPESEFKTSKTAPQDGYLDLFKIETSRKALIANRKSEDQKTRIFRIRTIKDEDGDIVSTYYGKFAQDFKLMIYRGFPEETPALTFHYSLNLEPNERNLEDSSKLRRD